jgi:5-methylcytosine-specific restriction endonuclease McrA
MSMTGAERSKRWRERHPDRAKNVQRAYLILHPEQRRDTVRRYRERNLTAERLRILANRVKSRGGAVYVIAGRDLRRLANAGCAMCGSRDRTELDHVIPISRGGHHGIGNVQVLCFTHNRGKQAMFLTEYRYKI